MKFLLPYFLWFCCLSGFAQDALPPVSLADVTARTYPADSNAVAVILSDFCDTSLDPKSGTGMVLRRKIRIKILKKAGYDWATVAVPFWSNGYRGKEFVQKIDGQTFNLDATGTLEVTPLRNRSVMEEKVSAGQYVKRFTLPNVREGSVIEYEFTLFSEFSYLNDWGFQRTIPVVRSEYRLLMGADFQYQILLQGSLPLSVDRSSKAIRGTTQYEWVMENIPAFREEPYLIGASDYVAKLRFQPRRRTLKTWEELDNRLLKDASFGQTLLDTGFLTAIGDSLRTQYPDTLARLTAAHTYVKQHLTWNGAHNLWADNLRDVFNRKKGDAADLNLLMVALLRAAGLEAYPLVLSTRDNGRVLTEYPSLTSFNYVTALTTLRGKDIFLDATSPHLPPDLLPPACLNGSGRVVDLKNARWVPLTPRQRLSASTTLRMAFGPDGSLSGQAEMACTGYAALLWRVGVSVKDTSNFLQKALEKAYPDFTVGQSSVANADSMTKAVSVRFALQSREPLQQAGERFYFTPLLDSERGENPFKAPSRTYPVDFGFPLEATNIVEYTLPPGVAVEELPKAMVFTLPNNDARFTYSVNLNGNQLQISSRLVLRKTLFTGEEYPTLRAFFDKIVAKHAEQVVLKRE